MGKGRDGKKKELNFFSRRGIGIEERETEKRISISQKLIKGKRNAKRGEMGENKRVAV